MELSTGVDAKRHAITIQNDHEESRMNSTHGFKVWSFQTSTKACFVDQTHTKDIANS